MVEDDAAQIALTHAQHEQLRLLMSLHTVESGEAALSYLREARTEETRPDLILVDLNLPGMSGLELLEALTQDDDFRAIPAVALSAVEPSRQTETALRKHARTWVEKPLSLAAWGKIVKAVPGIGLALVKLPGARPAS